MKRIVCMIVAIEMCMLSFAGQNPEMPKASTAKADKTQSEYVELINKLSAYATEVDDISMQLKNFIKKGEDLQKNIASLKEEKELLIKEKQSAESIITNPLNCRMLIEYPLMVKYDQELVAHSQNTIKAYKLDEKTKNKELCKAFLPILSNYEKYYKSVYDMIDTILKAYVAYNAPYSAEMFEKDKEKTLYFKQCYGIGFNIPFLDTQIDAVETLIKENRLTEGNLRYILNDMK